VAAAPAAVLVAMFEEDGEARVILTKRPDTMRNHQGQIAFPGGKFDGAVDPDLRATALREAREEIGLAPEVVEVVAELDHHVTDSLSFSLAPFVGLVAERPVLHPHPTEVVSVFDVALSELLDEVVYRQERWVRELPEAHPNPRVRHIHFFELAGETVWGVTARILAQFLERLTASRQGT
jgi:8-oxo-dGTP pyrophosphatase MutT (NUDIX family)